MLMRLVCRGSSRVREVPFPSPGVQRLQRTSILCNARLVFFIRCQEPVVFRAYPTMRVRLCLLNMSSVFEW